jgi:type II secretory pathway pseudopilin PulG
MYHASTIPMGNRRGFTMVELVVSLGISTAVMLGVVALLGLSSSAIPKPGGVQETAIDGADLLARISADVASATQVSALNGRTLSVVVPDRTGDNLDETIVYSWGGSAGDPVTRVVNGTLSGELLDSADLLDFSYTTKTTAIVTRQTKSVGATQILQSNRVDWPKFEELKFTDATAAITPTLAAGDVSWTLDSVVLFFAKSASSDQVVTVQLRGCDALGVPTASVYATDTVSEDGMASNFSPFVFSYSGIVVPAGERLCVVVRATDGLGDVHIGTVGSNPQAADATTIANPMALEATGSITAVAGGAASRGSITALDVRLRTGPEAWEVRTSVPIVNPPAATLIAAVVVAAE